MVESNNKQPDANAPMQRANTRTLWKSGALAPRMGLPLRETFRSSALDAIQSRAGDAVLKGPLFHANWHNERLSHRVLTTNSGVFISPSRRGTRRYPPNPCRLKYRLCISALPTRGPSQMIGASL